MKINVNKFYFWSGFLFLAAYVTMYAGIARYAFPSSDDYVYLRSLTDRGLWEAQLYLWNNLMSRFTASFIIHFGLLLGVFEHYSLHVYFWIALSVFSIYFFMSAAFPDARRSVRLLFALLFQSLWLAVTVGLNDSLYWWSGAPFYYSTVPLIIFEIAFIIKIMKGERAVFYFALSALAIVLNSGIIELSAAYQVPMFLAASLVSFCRHRHAARKISALFAVAFVCLLVHIFAPGNAARSAYQMGTINTGAVSISTLIKGMLSFGPLNALEFFSRPSVYVILLFMPEISENVRQAGFVSKLPFRLRIWHLLLLEVLTSLGFAALGGYTGRALPARAVGTVFVIMLVQWYLFFVFCYRSDVHFKFAGRPFIYRCRYLALLMCLVFNSNFMALLEDYKLAPAFYDYVSAETEYIRERVEQNTLDVLYPAFDGKRPNLIWYSRTGDDGAMAELYGLNSLRTVPREIMDTALRGNAEETLSALREVAEAGNFFARLTLAHAYDPRYGPAESAEKDSSEAVRFYAMLAEQGDQYSKRQLVGLLGRGWGTPDGRPDYLGTATWYMRSLW